jgi:hypothetical protein
VVQDICIFKRVEKKYLLPVEKKEALLSAIGKRLIPDAHGKSTICSLYLDTPTFLLIRNSIDATTYKEKLRIRSYGVPKEDGQVFFEIKKKYKGVVYKRRISSTLHAVEAYLQSGIPTEDSQIMRELHYAMELYKRPKPTVLIACEREAYFDVEHPNLRITFDSAVRYRDYGLSSADGLTDTYGSTGKQILPDELSLMEIKTDGAMPVWLAEALGNCEIYPGKFSKYGNAYLDIMKKGEQTYAYHL